MFDRICACLDDKSGRYAYSLSQKACLDIICICTICGIFCPEIYINDLSYCLLPTTTIDWNPDSKHIMNVTFNVDMIDQREFLIILEIHLESAADVFKTSFSTKKSSSRADIKY